MVGLISYLAGPGRANEHENPHLVAGSPTIMAWYDTGELSHEDALAIGGELDQPRRVYNIEWSKTVWHCSLSLPVEDGVLEDEAWGRIVTSVMTRLEFIGGVRADVPWVAIRHGLSGGNGNDHVHIAASLVREDGTRANPRLDAPRVQSICRALEREHGLTMVVPGKGKHSYQQAELYASKRRGFEEPERVLCARKVRAFATASATEAEFIRRCRAGGVLLRPNYAAGGAHVRGYAAALKPPAGQAPLYSGGANLSPDLGLKQLRRLWGADPEVTPPAAFAEWDASRFGRSTGVVGREAVTPSLEDYRAAAKELEALRERLRSVAPEDREAWRRTAAFLSGAFSAWAEAVEDTPGELSQVAEELAKSAAVPRSVFRHTKDVGPMGLRTATVLAFTAQQGGAAGQLAIFTQLGHLLRMFQQAQDAHHDMVRSRGIARLAQRQLRVITADLQEAVAAWEKEDPTARGVTRVEPRPVIGRVVERTIGDTGVVEQSQTDRGVSR